MKNTGATIAGIGAGIGSAVAQLPGQIRKQKEYEYDKKQREDAITELQNDWGQAGITSKALKKTLSDKGQKLVQSGAITQSELDADLKMLPMGKVADQKDRNSLEDYIKRQGVAYKNINDKYDSKLKKYQLGQDIEAAKKDKPAGFAPPEVSEEQTQITGPGGTPEFTEQNITARERTPEQAGAVTQSQIAGQMQPGTDMSALKEQPGFVTAPTDADLARQKAARKKEDRLAAKQEHLENYDALGWAKFRAKTTLDKEKLKLAEDKAKMSANKLIGSYKTDIMELDEQIKELKNPEPPPFGEPEPIDYNEIARVEAQKLNVQEEIDKLNAEKKQMGQPVGQTRTFSSQTGKETSRTPAPAPPIPSPTSSGMGAMEKAIRDSLAKKGVDPATIEKYVADRKAKGML